jgi:hypothetical protein
LQQIKLLEDKMAIQTIQRQPDWGSALSSGLQELAQSKIQRLQNQHKFQNAQEGSEQRSKGLQELFNFTPEEAEKVGPLFDNAEGLELLFNKLTPNQQAQQQQEQLPQQNVAQSPAPVIEQAAPQNVQTKQQLPVEPPLSNKPEVIKPIVEEKPINPISNKKLTKAEKEAHKAKKAAEKEQAALKEAKAAEEAAAQKETQKYYDQVLASDKEAHKQDLRLDRMLKLIDKGDLPYSTYYNLLKNIEEHVSPTVGAGAGAGLGGAIGTALGAAAGAALGGVGALPGGAAGAATGTAIGAGLGALVSPVVGVLRSIQRVTSPDTEEFEKLSNQFVNGVKQIFGGRVAVEEMKAFMSTIPTLSNTDAGKKKIINGMKVANEAEHIRAKNMKDIIKENKGKRPLNLPELVEERSADELDKLAKKFLAA